jgi:hypothetical protein
LLKASPRSDIDGQSESKKRSDKSNNLMKHKLFRHNLTASLAVCLITLANAQAMAADLAGSVQGAGEPVAGSTVTLFAAGSGTPKQLAQSKTDDNGAFKLAVAQAPADSILYVVAKGGIPKAAANKDPNDQSCRLATGQEDGRRDFASRRLCGWRLADAGGYRH